MREALLHFIWQFQLFDQQKLATSVTGEPVTVKKTGYHNHDAGPDFMNARIQVGDTLWAGHVEIHQRATDWFRHGHQHDPSYGNVILHVVLMDDRQAPESDSLANVPCIALQHRIRHSLLDHYEHLIANQQWVPCAEHFQEVEAFTIRHWLNRLQVERLNAKKTLIERLLSESGNDWEETLYQLIARNFGFKVNAEPFERLAKMTPYRIIAKHTDQPFQLEALLLGQAGMLEGTFSDTYPLQLKQEYQFLQRKYRLTPMKPHEWNYLRLRPANFPTVRICQMAQFLSGAKGIFHLFFTADTLEAVRPVFQVEATTYWQDHYWPDKKAKEARRKRLGKKSIDNLLINTVVPFIFSYGQIREEGAMVDQAMNLMETMPAEQNSILKKWESLGAPHKHAGHSQALLHLKKHYCDAKQCLSCEVGMAILKTKA